MTEITFKRCDGLIAAPPITLPRGRRRLSAIMKKYADKSRAPIVFVLRRRDPPFLHDQTVRMRATWSKTLLGPHDKVVIVYNPRGGQSGGRSGGGSQNKGASIGMLVAAVALAALGQFWAIGALAGALGTTTAIAGTIWAAGSAATIAGLGYLLAKSTKAKANTEQENRPLYGVSGGGNVARANDRIPVIYGRTWHNPDLSQPDYSIYEGEDQVLFKRLVIGCGYYSFKTVRVAGITFWTQAGGITPAFTGATLEFISPGATSTLVPGAVATATAVSNNQLPKVADFPNYAGPFDFGSGAHAQSRIQLDFTLQSCFCIPDGGKFEGKQYAADWGVQFETAPCDEDGNIIGAWSGIYSDGGSLLTTQPKRFTRFVDISPGNWAFRARNVGAPDTIAHSSGLFNAIVSNAVIWEGLRSHIPETIVRPGITELAMLIRSGKTLSVTAFGQVEVEVQRILPVWYGPSTGWIGEETSKAVWAYADILRDQNYGAGEPDSAIDLTTLKFYNDNLVKFDKFNGIIRGPVSVYDAATTVLGPMRSSPLRLGSGWSMIRDEAKAARKHVITRRQILSDSSNQTFTVDLSDGSSDVIVEWFTDGDTKKFRSKRVTIGSVTNQPRRIQAVGITDAEHAIHLATWAAAVAYYRREKRSVGMELSGRLVLPNDRAMIDMWYFDTLETVGIYDRDGLVLTSDTELPASTNLYGMFRARDGLNWGPVKLDISNTRIELDAADVAQAQLLSGITLENMLSLIDQADTSLCIGDLTIMQENYLVRNISFNGDNITIEANYDAPQVWSALGESILPPPPPPSSGLENEASAAIPWLRAEAVQKNGSIYMDWTCGRPRNADIYVVSISYDSWDTSEEVSRGTASSGSYPLREGSGIIFARAYAITPSGLKGPTTQTQFSYFPAKYDMGNAIHGSVKIEAFTDGIEPVGLVDGLPNPVGYSGKPKMVYDINTEKVYKYEGGQWVPLVNTEDLDGLISETQIDDDSISTPKLKANAVTAAKIAAQTITANEIAANAIIGGKIQAGAISADKINVTKLDAISADIGSITAGSLNINNRFMVAADGTTTIQSAASGQRLVITSAAVYVFDASNVMRVRMGIW